MKDQFIKKLKRSWLAIWIAFVAAALSTIGVLAAYTSVSSVKRVVSTHKREPACCFHLIILQQMKMIFQGR